MGGSKALEVRSLGRSGPENHYSILRSFKTKGLGWHRKGPSSSFPYFLFCKAARKPTKKARAFYPCGTRERRARVGFSQNGFFADFFFLSRPDFFADFVAGCLLLIFAGKSAQQNPPGKSPAKILQKNLYSKIPDAFLQRGLAKSREKRANKAQGKVKFWRRTIS